MASKSNQRRAIAALACGHLAAVGIVGCAEEDPLPAPRPFASQVGDGRRLSVDATCQGVGRSPLLQWRAPRDGFLAGIVSSGAPNDRTTHWLFWDQPSGPGGLAPGVRPGQHPPAQGRNAAGSIGWLPPCPAVDAAAPPTLDVELWWTSRPLHAPPTISAGGLRERAASRAEGTSDASIAMGMP